MATLDDAFWSGDRVAEIRTAVLQFLSKIGCRDRHVAEDVTQETLTKLYLHADKHDGRSIKTWAMTIARNSWLDTCRRTASRIGTHGIGGENDPLRRVADRQTAPPAYDADDICVVDAAIEQLPEIQRTVVRLRRAGVSNNAIAQRLGFSKAYGSELYRQATANLRESVCC